jgi:sulfopyruvate decarboxylase TPP-binding subunit
MVPIEAEAWPEHLFALLRRHDVTLFPYVPDEASWRFLQLVERDTVAQSYLMTTEEEGVAFCAGADLVGKRAALVMQSSGIGNCVNFFVLSEGAGFPILMIVSMRGEYSEANPWQYPMGQAAVPILRTMGIIPFQVHGPNDLDPMAASALAAVYKGGRSAALILSQRFLGAKTL